MITHLQSKAKKTSNNRNRRNEVPVTGLFPLISSIKSY